MNLENLMKASSARIPSLDRRVNVFCSVLNKSTAKISVVTLCFCFRHRPFVVQQSHEDRQTSAFRVVGKVLEAHNRNQHFLKGVSDWQLCG